MREFKGPGDSHFKTLFPSGSQIRGTFGLAGIMTSVNECCKNPTSKDAAENVDSGSYD